MGTLSYQGYRIGFDEYGEGEARSILEWRTRPKRLNEELSRVIDEVWSEADAPAPGSNGKGRGTAAMAG